MGIVEPAGRVSPRPSTRPPNRAEINTVEVIRIGEGKCDVETNHRAARMTNVHGLRGRFRPREVSPSMAALPPTAEMLGVAERVYAHAGTS